MLFVHMALQMFVEPEQAADLLKVKYCQCEKFHSTLRLKRWRWNRHGNFQIRTGLVKGSNHKRSCWPSVGLPTEVGIQRFDRKNRRYFHTRALTDCFHKWISAWKRSKSIRQHSSVLIFFRNWRLVIRSRKSENRRTTVVRDSFIPVKPNVWCANTSC